MERREIIINKRVTVSVLTIIMLIVIAGVINAILSNDVEISALKDEGYEYTQVLSDTEEYHTVYNHIKDIDKSLLSVLLMNDKTEITDDFMIDFAITYIIRNTKLFNEKIVDLNKQFVYEEEETEYYSIGYVDKEVVKNIIFDTFGVEDIELKNHKFYDLNSDFMALVPNILDEINYENSEFISLTQTGSNEYVAVVKYERNFLDQTNKFNVKYYLTKDDTKQTDSNKYNLDNISIYESKTYEEVGNE